MKKSVATLREEFQGIAGNPALCDIAFNAALARDFDILEDKKDFITFIMTKKAESMAQNQPGLDKKLAELERIYSKISQPAHAEGLPGNINELFTACIHAAFMHDIDIISKASYKAHLINLDMVLNCAIRPLEKLAPLYPLSLRNDLLDAAVSLLNSIDRQKISYDDIGHAKACAKSIIEYAEAIPAPTVAQTPATTTAVAPAPERKSVHQYRIVQDVPGQG